MNPRLSIALVTETYPPELNGVALTIERAVRHLVGRGHRVGLVRPRQAPDDAREAVRDGSRGDENTENDERVESAATQAGHPEATDTLLVRGLPLPRYPGLQLGLPAPWRLVRHWRRTRPDVVHIVTEGPLGWSALAAARHLGIPVTSDYRTNFQTYSGFYRLGQLAGVIDRSLRNFHNRTDMTFVATAALADELRGRGYRRLACVGRGVDAELFSPQRRSAVLRARWGVAPDQLAVLHVGRLAPEKNPAMVLEAFHALRRTRPDARLVWVGDGPLRESLAHDADGQLFAGVQRGEALAEHYASADLFLFPSLTETFGNVTLEAMASGLPVVAFDIGAAREHLADGANACVPPPGDGEAFVAAACALATEGALRRRLGAAAREVAVQLGWPVILGRFEAHLVAQAARHVPAGDVATAA